MGEALKWRNELFQSYEATNENYHPKTLMGRGNSLFNDLCPTALKIKIPKGDFPNNAIDEVFS